MPNEDDRTEWTLFLTLGSSVVRTTTHHDCLLYLSGELGTIPAASLLRDRGGFC